MRVTSEDTDGQRSNLRGPNFSISLPISCHRHVWWHTSPIQALRRLRQEFETNLVNYRAEILLPTCQPHCEHCDRSSLALLLHFGG